jgi:heat shock protein HspQ
MGHPATPCASKPSCTRSAMRKIKKAKYAVGQVVRHRFYPFRGIIFDVDPVFNNTEAWWLAIPKEIRPRKDQPFYHLLAENAETEYIAYVSEQNLLADHSGAPLRNPRVSELFLEGEDGRYHALFLQEH